MLGTEEQKQERRHQGECFAQPESQTAEEKGGSNSRKTLIYMILETGYQLRVRVPKSKRKRAKGKQNRENRITCNMGMLCRRIPGPVYCLQEMINAILDP